MCFTVSEEAVSSSSSDSCIEQGYAIYPKDASFFLKAAVKEQKEGSNDLMLPVKPQLGSGGGGIEG